MNHKSTLPIIGITMGDPIGIGPEIAVKAMLEPKISEICRPVLIGDPHIVSQAADLLHRRVSVNKIDAIDQAVFEQNTLDIYTVSDLNINFSGQSVATPETGKAMLDYLLTGIRLAKEKKIDAIVTCPITKTAMKLAGSKFHGHTELFAHHTKTDDFAMMLTGASLKVVLVTIHIPLKEVSDTLTKANILKTIFITHKALTQRFGIPDPQIAVAGLNPHSGEESLFGTEERDIIEPAVRKARRQGLSVIGPVPPDTVFYKAVSRQFDAVVCMYHDQGLIPFKLVHFKDGVNTTLGLPIIRTSVDHGTAYDIAWQGIADHTSLHEAIKMAAFQVRESKD